MKSKIKEDVTVEKSKKAALLKPQPVNNAQYNEKIDQSSNDFIEANNFIAKIIDDLYRIEDLKKQLLNKEESLKDLVKDYMQDARILKIGYKHLASWKTHTRESFDIASFKTHFPEVYSSFLKDNSYRVFKLC